MFLKIVCSLAWLAVAAQSPIPKASELHDPPGHAIAFQLRTLPTSVQIYTCNGSAWSGPDPDAIVANGDRSLIVHHYKGPEWEATDGSMVRGSNARHFLAPRPGSVDWLELTAGGGTGQFAKVVFIHRIETVGGLAPAQVCDAGENGVQVRVPYSATYLFYK
jgi:hypothetical protein